jgi:hypothetical protein
MENEASALWTKRTIWEMMYAKIGLEGVNLNINKDRRACDRSRCSADIAFSYFNGKHCYEAQTLNLCSSGMSFQSKLFLKPGSTVYIRLVKVNSSGADSGVCEDIRSVALAEVKWCNEQPGANDPSYNVGVKYVEPDY